MTTPDERLSDVLKRRSAESGGLLPILHRAKTA